MKQARAHDNLHKKLMLLRTNIKDALALQNFCLVRHYPPLMGGINATTSPDLRGKTSPDGTYSSLSANVKLSSSSTMDDSLGYLSDNVFLQGCCVSEL